MVAQVSLQFLSGTCFASGVATQLAVIEIKYVLCVLLPLKRVASSLRDNNKQLFARLMARR